MNLRHTNPEYFQDITIERYRKYYKELGKYNAYRAEDYINLASITKSYVTDLFTKYANNEGLLSYSESKTPLNTVEKANYYMFIENMLSTLNQENHINQANLYLMEKTPNRLDSIVNLAKLNGYVVAENDLEHLLDFLTKVYLDNYTKSLYELQKGIGVGMPVEEPNRDNVRNQILEPWAELPLVDYINNIQEKLAVENKKSLTTGLTNGIALVTILKMLDKNVVKAYNNQKLINESELSHNMNTSKEKSTVNSGISGSYIIIATLDSRTTEICKDMDGKVFSYSDKKVGVNYPGFHFGCRTTTAEYFDDDDIEKYTRIARDLSTNQNYYINASITYRDWERAFLGK